MKTIGNHRYNYLLKCERELDKIQFLLRKSGITKFPYSPELPDDFDTYSNNVYAIIENWVKEKNSSNRFADNYFEKKAEEVVTKTSEQMKKFESLPINPKGLFSDEFCKPNIDLAEEVKKQCEREMKEINEYKEIAMKKALSQLATKNIKLKKNLAIQDVIIAHGCEALTEAGYFIQISFKCAINGEFISRFTKFDLDNYKHDYLR